jgi:hypothetical protein
MSYPVSRSGILEKKNHTILPGEKGKRGKGEDFLSDSQS